MTGLLSIYATCGKLCRVHPHLLTVFFLLGSGRFLHLLRCEVFRVGDDVLLVLLMRRGQVPDVRLLLLFEFLDLHLISSLHGFHIRVELLLE